MRSPRRILVPTDLSTFSLEALEYAEEIASLFATEIVLLHAIDRCDRAGKPKTGAEIDEQEFEARKSLIHALMERRIVPKNLKIELRGGKPVEAIIRAIGQLETDLVIMCSHGRTGWSHALIGSVAEQVVRLSPVPVVVVKGQGVDAEDIHDDVRFDLHMN